MSRNGGLPLGIGRNVRFTQALGDAGLDALDLLRTKSSDSTLVLGTSDSGRADGTLEVGNGSGGAGLALASRERGWSGRRRRLARTHVP